MKLCSKSVVVGLGLFLFSLLNISESLYANASFDKYLVLGVVASTKDQVGVALMKNMQTKKTFAVREGKAFAPNSFIAKVKNRYVDVIMDGDVYSIRVGDNTDMASKLPVMGRNNTNLVSNTTGIEKSGDVVKIEQSYKEYMLNNNLSTILMQAAAVPYEMNGRLKGFQLWDIEKGSVYNQVGLDDGDIVTQINGEDLVDAGRAIKTLNSLRNAKEAKLTYVRHGQPHTLKIHIQ